MKKEKVEITQEERMVNRFKYYDDAIKLFEALLLIAIIGTLVFIFQQLLINNFNFDIAIQTIMNFLQYEGAVSKLQFITDLTVKFTSLIVLVDCLRRIMQDTYKQKKPFIKNNINRMNIIAICSIFYSKDIIYFLIVLAVKELFQYGYKLQIESDETL